MVSKGDERVNKKNKKNDTVNGNGRNSHSLSLFYGMLYKI